MDKGEFRPRYHYTPPQNWMNDPNGLVCAGGVYHLYYQHNPYGTEWGHMSWGHATSTNLVSWDHQPIAIWEDPDEGYTVFSGSAVIDHGNTSGLGADGTSPLVAVYTADYSTRDPQLQDVHIAYSLDGGESYVPYVENPVIAVGARKFGDPKVFWHAPSQRWIMVTICGLGQGYAVLYGSQDLKTWTRLSEFHASGEAPGVWECPDLFPLAVDGDPDDVAWVLKVNCVTFGGGSPATRYFAGAFDGETFVDAVPIGHSLTSDEGAIYAEVTYNDVPDGRRILVGWLRQQPHELRPWTGAQSVPRTLSLARDRDGLQLRQRPVKELEAGRGLRTTVRDRTLTGTLPIEHPGVARAALEIALVLDLRGATEGGIRLRLDGGGEVTVGVNGTSGELSLVTGNDQRIATPVTLTDRPVSLRVLLDQEIVEAFVDETAAVTGFLPYGSRYRSLEAYGQGVAPHLVRADVWAIGDD